MGCGNGNIISLLKKERDAFYYGLDISKNMIEEAKKRCGEDVDENAGFKVYDWKKINYRTFIFNAKKIRTEIEKAVYNKIVFFVVKI